MNAVALTFAELHYLLSGSDTARRRLQLREDADGALALCGLSSLAARGLLHTAGEAPRPREDLVPFVEALTSPTAWVELGLVRANGEGGVQIFDSAEHRVNVVAQPYGTFVLAEADRGLPLPEAVAELLSRYFSEDGPAGVILKAERGNESTPSSAMALRSLEQGIVEISREADAAESSETLTLGEASTAVERLLGAVA